MPGPFLDAHIHLWEFCLFQNFTDLESIGCLDECNETLKSQDFGDWLVGVRFNQENTIEKLIPDCNTLDNWFGNKPALIVRSCLHLITMNTTAMQRLNIYSHNGLFLEKDVFWVLNSIASMIGLDSRAVIKKGWKSLDAAGYSRVIDMATDKQKRALFNKLDYYTMDWDLLDESLGFKFFLDGSLGARTAALLQPYSDDPGNYGQLNYTDSELLELVDKVHNLGKPVACHAIGDRAVDQFIKVISKSRHPLDRVEHLQVATFQQIENLSELGVAICIQPSFSAELPWALLRLGNDRIKTAYAWNLMREKNIKLLAGTDAPVDGLDPCLAAHLADLQEGDQHLDHQASLQLFAKDNWDYYDWMPGSSIDLV